jgi:flagellar basal-body rod protein FlgG
MQRSQGGEPVNYGMYLSAYGVLTNLHRQDVIANNLANASTVGFRRDLAAFTQRLPESRENPGPDAPAHDLLDRLGGGLFVRPTETDFRPGRITQSGNDLDLAIAGDGFFAVRTNQDGQDHVRITRDGRFTLAADGRMVTTTAGHEVLDTAGRPIRLAADGPVTIDAQGLIRQRGEDVARLRLVDVADTRQIKHLGQGLYQAPAAALDNPAQATGRIQQGWIEQANIDPVREMVAMIQTTRAINNNSALMRYHDVLNERVVNQFGRLPQ